MSALRDCTRFGTNAIPFVGQRWHCPVKQKPAEAGSGTCVIESVQPTRFLELRLCAFVRRIVQINSAVAHCWRLRIVRECYSHCAGPRYYHSLLISLHDDVARYKRRRRNFTSAWTERRSHRDSSGRKQRRLLQPRIRPPVMALCRNCLRGVQSSELSNHPAVRVRR
jgi:hypothetical protein